MAGAGGETEAPPTLVDNAETLAHVTIALAEGADWFREVGTEESPGTFLCTVSGCVTRAGVGEFAMGTPLREVIETVGGGARPGRTIRAVLQGAAAAIITADQLDTPASWEGMQAIGSGLGAAAFIVLDDDDRHRGGGRERVAFPGRRVVRSVHPVQAGRLADHRCAGADRDVCGHRRRSRHRSSPDRDRHVRCALLAGHAAAGGGRQHPRGLRGRARSAGRAHRARRRAVGDRADDRSRQRGCHDRPTTTRASSPTGPTPTTGRASPPPTASTITAPTTKSSDQDPDSVTDATSGQPLPMPPTCRCRDRGSRHRSRHRCAGIARARNAGSPRARLRAPYMDTRPGRRRRGRARGPHPRRTDARLRIRRQLISI